MKSVLATVFAVALLAGSTRSAAAAPLTINIGSFSGGTAMLHAPGTLADGLTVVLGSVLITGDLGSFESYCVDLQHYDLPGSNQTLVNTMDQWNDAAVPALPSLGGGAASWLYDAYAAGAVGNQTKEAALSLAIWNALYDNDFTVLSGTGFWVSSVSNSNYASLANQYLLALQPIMTGSKPLPNDTWLQTVNVSNHYSQDFIAPARVPEPATLSLLGLGMACGIPVGRRAGRRAHRWQVV